MPIRRQFEPRQFEAQDVTMGGIEPAYGKVLIRLLAAHALAEKLTAEGYRRVLTGEISPDLRATAEKNLDEEHEHARIVYRLLAELGVDETRADRLTIGLRRAPSFAAPSYFAQHASGDLDLLMGSISLDLTGLIMIGINYRDSSYAPHARAAEVILEEEADHDVFAAAALALAVERFAPRAVNEALRRWWPMAVNFFGPPGSGFTYDCLRMGLKQRDNQELAELFTSIITRRLAHLGLEPPRITATYPHSLV